MKCFQVVKQVLDTLYMDISANTEENDRIIIQALNQLQKDYKAIHTGSKASYSLDAFDPFLDETYSFGIETKVVNYSDPATKFAYVYKYAASHADMVYQRISESATLRKLFDRDKLKVCCIGCGPGSDLLGISKFLAIIGKSPQLNVALYDREVSWSKELSAIFKKAMDIRRLDITNKNFTQYKHFTTIDLFTIVYFVSEAYTDRDNAEHFFNYLFDNMKPGSIMIFVDNGTPTDFYQWFDNLVRNHNLETIAEENDHRFRFSREEEKTDLGIYYTKFAEENAQCPKLTATIAYRICRKQ